jgi:hypothetical protein
MVINQENPPIFFLSISLKLLIMISASCLFVFVGFEILQSERERREWRRRRRGLGRRRKRKSFRKTFQDLEQMIWVRRGNIFNRDSFNSSSSVGAAEVTVLW